MARLLVGLPAPQGDLAKYATRFDMVEVRPVDTPIPKASTLRKWRKSVPPAFVFSVVLPRVVGDLTPGTALDEALAASLEVAAALEARCVVLATPPEVRPTATNKKRIAAIFDRIPSDGTVRCWEPAGIWERDEVLATARAMGVLPVFDAAREALGPGPIAYTRLRALGKSAALGQATIDRVADRLRRRRESFVVVEGPREAQRVKQALVASLAKKPARAAGVTVVRPAISTLVAEDEEQ
ncbi:Hypothetical protein A7982_00582 [Minicystis rosea]|nr:Hypothetical protein A7982_00582 [Minicystis rosea]